MQEGEPTPSGGAGDIDLPPPDTRRWTIARKLAVVLAVQRRLLSLDEACERYRLSPEEFASWERAIERHRPAGLRATRVQIYRDTLEDC